MESEMIVDPELSKQVTTEAIESSEADSEEDWLDEAVNLIHDVAKRQKELTSEDIWNAGLSYPEDASSLGPAFLIAARAGYISRIKGRVEYSNIPCQHRKPMRVWRSEIFGLDNSLVTVA